MILFFQSGRLGNQLFQYCAMKAFPQKGKIVAIGFSELCAIIDGVEIPSCSPRPGFPLGQRILLRFFRPLIRSMSLSLRLLSVVTEDVHVRRSTYSVKPGLVPNAFYFDPGYYQAEHVADPAITGSLHIRRDFRARAQTLLRTFPCSPEDRFFVHIRRGDYAFWPSPEAPAALPISWYQTQMDLVRQSRPQAFFFILSDDPNYVKARLPPQHRTTFVHNCLGVDFAVMAECFGGGILSPSSFSWWGAFFARRQNPKGLFIAPRYWAGHALKQWFPESIETSWIRYAD